MAPAAAAAKQKALVYRDEATRAGVVLEIVRNMSQELPTKFNEIGEYMREIWDIPALTEKEQYLPLFERYRNGNEEERLALRNAIVLGNMRLVLSVARRYGKRAEPLLSPSDFLQEGIFGLVTAIEKYDPSRGAFSTYAVQWIREAISRAIQDMSPQYPFRVPAYLQERAWKVKRAVDLFIARKGVFPRPVDVLKIIRKWEFEKYLAGEERKGQPITLKDIKQCLRVLNIGKIPLDKPMAIDEEGGTIAEVIPARKTPHPHTAANARDHLAECRAKLAEIVRVINGFPQREAMVMRLRLGLVPGLPKLTFEEIGARYDVTRERIRQIEVKAEKRLAAIGIIIGDIDDVENNGADNDGKEEDNGTGA